MKRLLYFVAIFAALVVTFMFFSAFQVPETDAYQTVNIAGRIDQIQRPEIVWTWIGDRWELIALVISEIAAFLPAKVNGIAQAVVQVLGLIFRKNK